MGYSHSSRGGTQDAIWTVTYVITTRGLFLKAECGFYETTILIQNTNDALTCIALHPFIAKSAALLHMH
jgi:hypothetical protein